MAEVDLGRVQGFSAYEVAKQNGYVGTEAQWLESLHGPKGNDGAPGKDGADGASAGFGTPMASVDANVGTPSVTIEASGSNAAKVFNFVFKNLKGEKGDKGERGPAGSVVVDDALSSTSVNPVQNKVVKAEFDNVNSNLSALDNSKLKGYTVGYNVPVNSGGWHKIAQITGGYFNFDLYTTGGWTNQRKSNAHFQIQNINGDVRIVQLSGLADTGGGIRKIRMVRVVDDRDTWILEEHSSSSPTGEFFKFTIAGDVTVTPLDGSVDITTDFKDSVSLDVSDIPTGAVITTSNVDNALSSTSTYPVQNKVVKTELDQLKNDLSNLKDGTTPAAKAVADEDGNNIKNTYAKKTDIPSGGGTTEDVTISAVPGVSQSVVNNSKCKNDRVVLDFYITVNAGTYKTMRVADIMSNHGPTEVVYGTAICTTKYSSFDEYTKPYPFQINKAKSIELKMNEKFTTNMTFYISLAYDI